ncbi:MAG: hypothetical protein EHM41_19285, partial [Chloroflexi bacterium]
MCLNSLHHGYLISAGWLVQFPFKLSVQRRKRDTMLQKPNPILVADRFPTLLDTLLTLLASLSDEEWFRPVHGGEWTVKDLAQHLLGDEINILSGRRDGFSGTFAAIDSWEDLVAFINRNNTLWVQATRRMSPKLICDLLRNTG